MGCRNNIKLRTLIKRHTIVNRYRRFCHSEKVTLVLLFWFCISTDISCKRVYHINFFLFSYTSRQRSYENDNDKKRERTYESDESSKGSDNDSSLEKYSDYNNIHRDTNLEKDRDSHKYSDGLSRDQNERSWKK